MVRKITTASAFCMFSPRLYRMFSEWILFMYPDDLPIQIKWFHTVAGNTDTKICTGSYFIAYFYFRESVRIEELAGSG